MHPTYDSSKMVARSSYPISIIVLLLPSQREGSLLLLLFLLAFAYLVHFNFLLGHQEEDVKKRLSSLLSLLPPETKVP